MIDVDGLDELRLPCLAAMRQPLYTYPTEPVALLARLLQDVHLLRLVLAIRAAGEHLTDEALSDQTLADHMAMMGLAGALTRLGGTLSVTRAEYDALRANSNSIAMRKRPDGAAIDFVLEGPPVHARTRTPLRGRPRRPRR